MAREIYVCRTAFAIKGEHELLLQAKMVWNHCRYFRDISIQRRVVLMLSTLSVHMTAKSYTPCSDF